MNDLKYWPSNAGAIAFSTLQTFGINSNVDITPRLHTPAIFVVSLYFYHVPQRKDEPFQRFILLVLYYDYRLVDMSLGAKSRTSPDTTEL